MLLDYTQLEALLAVKRCGSFEGASRALGISPIGVSRRVTKLEAELGAKLLDRKPTRPTEAGEAACLYAERIEALEKRVLEEQKTNALQPPADNATITIAINHDSLYGWFNQVLKERSNGPRRQLLDISLVDQDSSIELMKSGQVIAAISGHNEPVHGFKVFHLGCMSYRAVASPEFVKKHFGDAISCSAVNVAPYLRYNNQDGLVSQWLGQHMKMSARAVSSRLPCTKAIVDACVSGRGWAMITELDAKTHLESGSLMEIVPDTPLLKDMYWHVSSAMADTIADITSSIRQLARAHYTNC